MIYEFEFSNVSLEKKTKDIYFRFWISEFEILIYHLLSCVMCDVTTQRDNE